MAKLQAAKPATGRSAHELHPVKTVGFLVIPNFTTIGFASAVETLRMANLCLLYTSDAADE